MRDGALKTVNPGTRPHTYHGVEGSSRIDDILITADVLLHQAGLTVPCTTGSDHVPLMATIGTLVPLITYNTWQKKKKMKLGGQPPLV